MVRLHALAKLCIVSLRNRRLVLVPRVDRLDVASEVLAQSCQHAFNLGPAGVEVEAPWAGKLLDVRVAAPNAVIELKYHRPMPSRPQSPDDDAIRAAVGGCPQAGNRRGRL
jgi:hypothetical protein